LACDGSSCRACTINAIGILASAIHLCTPLERGGAREGGSKGHNKSKDAGFAGSEREVGACDHAAGDLAKTREITGRQSRRDGHQHGDEHGSICPGIGDNRAQSRRITAHHSLRCRQVDLEIHALPVRSIGRVVTRDSGREEWANIIIGECIR